MAKDKDLGQSQQRSVCRTKTMRTRSYRWGTKRTILYSYTNFNQVFAFFSLLSPSSWTTKAVRWRYWPKHAAPSGRIPQTPSCWRRTSRSPQSNCSTSQRARVDRVDPAPLASASRHQWMAVHAINPRRLAVIHPALAPVPWSSSNCPRPWQQQQQQTDTDHI